MIALPPDEEAHPGLLLDKWHEPWPVEPQLGAFRDKKEYQEAKRKFDEFARLQLNRVTQAANDPALLTRISERFDTALATFEHRKWPRKTSGPLTLHLSRAGSFENAGICLHALYGCAFLPGTGVKGMAHSYARNVAHANEVDIQAVFGKDTTRQEDGAAGGIVFFDAWPVSWPKLIVDIVNSHHGNYYRGDGPPGDWENPVPINFLAVAPGMEFEFRVAARRRSVNSERLLDLAQAWIDGAVAWLGAGAKTNAGYGRFSSDTALPTESSRLVFTCRLTLVSPAFLAGALQGEEDCTLRPATLRGLLRWWWRAMHAGHLASSELLRLERLIWGGAASPTSVGKERDLASVVSLALEPVGEISPVRYRKAEEASRWRLAKPVRAKAVQGLSYITFGMDEKDRSRYYVQSGSQWRLTIVARPAGQLSSQQVLDQARAALWLLANFGGLGSKCRKGFGCIEVDTGLTGLEECKRRAAEARAAVGFQTRQSGFLHYSSGLENMLGPSAIDLPGHDPWNALDQLGDAIQEFAQSYKHRIEKKALGLPRRMREADSELQQLGRHASPVHFHLTRSAFGFQATVVAFPSEKLRSFEKNREFLSEFITELTKNVAQRVETFQAPLPLAAAPPPSSRASGSVLRVGTIIEGVLLEEKTKKGGWKARETSSGLAGAIQNSQTVPPGAKPGDRVKLKIKIANPKDPAFEYIH
jgi:CRISPR-associated protein Cmr6